MRNEKSEVQNEIPEDPKTKLQRKIAMEEYLIKEIGGGRLTARKSEIVAGARARIELYEQRLLSLEKME
jgi:hypothetical protein